MISLYWSHQTQLLIINHQWNVTDQNSQWPFCNFNTITDNSSLSFSIVPWHEFFDSFSSLPVTLYNSLLRKLQLVFRSPCHRLERTPLVSDPVMHHGTCVTHVPWCMSGSLTGGGGENVPGIPGACATLNCTYLARGPYRSVSSDYMLLA